MENINNAAKSGAVSTPSASSPRFANDVKKLDDENLSSSQDVRRGSLETTSLSSSSQVAVGVYFSAFSRQFSNSSVSTESFGRQPAANESLFDISKVVDTVFGAIQQSLFAAKDRGASQEQIDSLFSQAQAGINQGTDEALTELEDLLGQGDTLDDLTESIESTRTQLTDKVTDLEENFLERLATRNTPLTDTDNRFNFIRADQYLASTSASSTIELVTAEGDKVQIQLAKSQDERFASVFNQQGDGRSFSSEYSLNSSQYYAYSVEGDLSDDEKEAIGELLNQIADVQSSFFSKDIEKAFNQAMELDIDFEQISSLSFELKYTQSIAAQRYAQVSNYDETNAVDSNAGNALPPEANNPVTSLAMYNQELLQLKQLSLEITKFDNSQMLKLLDKVFNTLFEPEASSQSIFKRLASEAFSE